MPNIDLGLALGLALVGVGVVATVVYVAFAALVRAAERQPQHRGLAIASFFFAVVLVMVHMLWWMETTDGTYPAYAAWPSGELAWVLGTAWLPVLAVAAVVRLGALQVRPNDKPRVNRLTSIAVAAVLGGGVVGVVSVAVWHDMRSADAGAFVQLAFAPIHRCGVREDGSVWCAGANYDGQLGLPGRRSPRMPARVEGVDDVVHVALNDSASCALERGGGVKCWGRGLPRPPRSGSGPPHARWRLPGVDSAIEITLEAAQLHALTRDGRVVGHPRPAPEEIDAAVALDSSGSETCVVLESGGVTCWKDGEDGEDTIRALPIPDAIDVAVADRGPCAVHRTGAVSCWYDGESYAVPTPPAQQIAAVSQFVCMRLEDLRVQCRTLPFIGPVEEGDGARTVFESATDIYTTGGLVCARLPDGPIDCVGTSGDRMAASEQFVSE